MGTVVGSLKGLESLHSIDWQDHLPGPSEATQGMLAQTRTSCSRGRSGPVPYSCTTPYEYLLTKT